MHKGKAPQGEMIIMAQGKTTAWGGNYTGVAEGGENFLISGSKKVLIVCCFLQQRGHWWRTLSKQRHGYRHRNGSIWSCHS